MLVLLFLLLLAGCSNDPARNPLPVVVDMGGPKMAHPQLVTMTYGNDADVATLQAFAKWIVGSQWLTQVGAEYGVGAGSVLGSVTIAATAPANISEDDIVNLLFAGLDAGTIPSSDFANTLYLFYLPAQTTVNGGTAGSQGCKDYLGFHASARRKGREISYAVLPSCPNSIANLGALETREEVASHEIIEAATDPLPGANPAFQVADITTGWNVLGNEVADLCSRGDDSRTVHEAGFAATRSWSKAAAAAGGEPCVPVPAAQSYFNVAANPSGILRAAPGATVKYRIGAFAKGDTKQVNLAAFSFTDASPGFTFGNGTLGVGSETSFDVVVPAASNAGDELQIVVVARTASDYQFVPLRIAVGDNCAAATDCVSCATRDGCGWCAKSSRCELEGPSGSAESGCSGDDFAESPGACPGFCATHDGTCLDCSSQFGCGWCNTGSGVHCLQYGGNGSAPKNATCAYADWDLSPDYCE